MKISIVAGARPNFMKIAPLLHSIEKFRSEGYDIEGRLIYTGKQEDKSIGNTLFEDLQIKEPDTYLNVENNNQNERAAGIMTAFEKELIEHPADIVVVVDDLTPTMACSIVAKRLNIKVAHLVAGTRSFDMSMPKEVNRMITDGLSDYLFTAGFIANHNLNQGGASLKNAYMVGNILMDTLRNNRDRIKQPAIYKEKRLNEDGYLLFTANRHLLVNNTEKFNEIIEKVCNAVKPYKVIASVHEYVANAISQQVKGISNLVITSPMNCLEFWYIEKNAMGIITDSGNIAEEATFLGIPCITLNNYTEHKETVSVGTNELVGENADLAAKMARNITLKKWKTFSIPERWDGRTADRIIRTLIDCYNKN